MAHIQLQSVSKPVRCIYGLLLVFHYITYGRPFDSFKRNFKASRRDPPSTQTRTRRAES